MGIIFQLEQIILDSPVAAISALINDYKTVYNQIPNMYLFPEIDYLITTLAEQQIEIAVITTRKKEYCDKILAYYRLTDHIRVYYHNPELCSRDAVYKIALNNMLNKEDSIIAGISEADMQLAKQLHVKGMLLCLSEEAATREMQIRPHIICKSTGNLFSYLAMNGVRLRNNCLRKRRGDEIYFLFDYYPLSRGHDEISAQLFTELKGGSENFLFCNVLCQEIKKKFAVSPGSCGIFIVPSSTEYKWNEKLMTYVVSSLVTGLGLKDCSKHIERYKSHVKQSRGGDRSIESNLMSMRIDQALPPRLTTAIIIDDIATTGSTFKACKELLLNKGVKEKNIYCIAIGSTILP